MNSPTFEKYLSQNSLEVNIYSFIVNLFLCAFLSISLGIIYNKFGRSISNRKNFSQNFTIISMTTLLIITIIKQSLALSLGLVGALSIIRFRTAIKEPEELANLFLCIAIGIGLGANQVELTIIAFLIILLFVIFTNWRNENTINTQSLFITIKSEKRDDLFLESINSILKKYCRIIDLKRLDESEETLEYTFMINFRDVKDLDQIKNKIREFDKTVNISFIDNTL